MISVISSVSQTFPIIKNENEENKTMLVRSRDEFGRFIGDDPSTPDINEAWTTL